MSNISFQILFNGSNGLGFLSQSAGTAKTSLMPNDAIVSVVNITDMINMAQVFRIENGQIIQTDNANLSSAKLLITFSRSLAE